jgi:integrase
MNGRIRKRGKRSWELTIDIGRDENGERLRKFVNVKGTKAEAQRQQRELLASLDKGLPVDTGKLNVDQFLQRWLRDYAIPNTRPRTAERYESDIRLHITPALGHLQLSRLAPSNIQTMEARLQESGKSARSVQHVHTVLREALKHAMRWGLIYRNVAEAVDAPRPKRHEIQPPLAGGVWDILELAKATPYYAVYHFIAFTGSRRGEALGLRWSDVDLENGTASIVQTLQRLRGKGLVVQPPKSDKSRRSIALDHVTVAMLREHRGRQLLNQVELGEAYHNRGLVFPGPLGEPLDPSVLTRNFEKLARNAALSGTRLHDLRHFHATLLLQTGTHPKIVQERLGHSSISITLDTYSHVVPGLQEQAANAFAAAMEKAQNSSRSG